MDLLLTEPTNDESANPRSRVGANQEVLTPEIAPVG